MIGVLVYFFLVSCILVLKYGERLEKEVRFFCVGCFWGRVSVVVYFFVLFKLISKKRGVVIRRGVCSF